MNERTTATDQIIDPYLPPVTVAVKPPSSEAPPRGKLSRVVAGASVGSFVEYFDLGAYSFLAVTIATVFFPPGNDAAALLSTFAIFAVSFFARPLGGIVWGHFGDRIGRKRTLTIVITVMSVSTFLIGLLPGYATIGVLAPVLLVLLRFIQGISAGGEITGAAAFIAEHSPDNRRGFLTSWIQASTTGAMVAGIITASALQSLISPGDMAAWGWRIPFLMSAPLGLIGLYIRNRLQETPKFTAMQATGAGEQISPLRQTFSSVGNMHLILLAMSIAVLQTVAFYVMLSYLPTYLIKTVGLVSADAYLTVGISATVLMCLIPFMGHLSDRVGRRRMLIGATTVFFLLTIPSFAVINQGGTANALLGQLILVMPASATAAPLLASQGEIFATGVRYTGHAIAMGLVAAIFGGSAPFIAQALTGATGSAYIPAFMIMAAAAVSFVAGLVMKETAHQPLRD